MANPKRTDVAEAEACLDGHDLIQDLLSPFLFLLFLCSCATREGETRKRGR